MLPFIDLGFIQMPTYGLCMIVAIYLAAGLMLWRSRHSNVPTEYLIIIQISCIVSFVIGAKVFFIFASYSLVEIFQFIAEGDFDFIVNSGLVFYGGLIFGIIGALGVAKLLKVDLLGIENHIVPFVPLGHAIGRVGCFMAGCCYGMKYDGPLAVYYPEIMYEFIEGPIPGVGYFPVQLVESVLDIVIFVILLFYVKKERPRGNVLFLYLLMYAIMRFCTELFRGDEIRGIHFNISTSQWISIALIAVFVARVIYHKVKNNKLNKYSN